MDSLSKASMLSLIDDMDDLHPDVDVSKATGFPYRCVMKDEEGRPFGDWFSEEAGLKTCISFEPKNGEPSTIEVRFTISFIPSDAPEDSKKLHTATASIFLGYQDMVDDPCCCQIVHPNQPAIKDGIPTLTITPGMVEINPDIVPLVEKGSSIWHLSLKVSAERRHAYNLFTAADYGDMTAQVNRLRTFIRSARSLDFLIRGEMFFSDAKVTFTAFKRESKLRFGNMSKWHVNHPDEIYIEDDDLTPPEHRPKVRYRPKWSFRNIEEYVTFLGYAMAYEQEAVDASGDERHVNLKVMNIPQVENRRYLAFLNPEECSYRFSPGDLVSVNFNCKEPRSALDWPAVIIDSAPFAPPGWLTMLLKRPWNKYEKRLCYFEHEPKVISADTVMADSHFIARQPGQPTVIKPDICRSPYLTQVEALRSLQSETAPDEQKWEVLRETLLANDFASLPRANLYESIIGEFSNDFVSLAKFDPSQLDAFNMLQDLPGRLGLVQGPPGTGKTYWLLRAVLPFVLYPNRTDSKTQQVLLVSSGNVVVNHLAMKMDELLRSDWVQKKRKDLIVIRVHPLTTEENAIGLSDPVERRADKKKAKQSFIPEDDLITNLETVQSIVDFYNQQTVGPTGINDSRLQHVQLSLGYRMLEMAGIISAPWSRPGEHLEFRRFFHESQGGQSFEPGTKDRYARAICALRDATLRKADVIVCTHYAAGQANLYTVIRPEVVGIDEAAKTTEPEMWSVFSHYRPAGWLMVGDHQQLAPTVLSKSDANPLRQQLCLSLFQRLVGGGLGMTMLRTQYRMHPSISAIVNTIFYAGRLIDAVTTGQNTTAIERSEFFQKQLGMREGNVAFLDVPGSETTSLNTSLGNPLHVHFILALVTLLLQGQQNVSSCPAEAILILVPYEYQWRLYRQEIARRVSQHPELRKVDVRKIDSFQGGEKSVVIFDFTVTDRAGFIKEGGRLNVALSRAQHALYLVGNWKAMYGIPRRYMGDFLPELVRQIVGRRLKVVDRDLCELASDSLCEARGETKWRAQPALAKQDEPKQTW